MAVPLSFDSPASSLRRSCTIVIPFDSPTLSLRRSCTKCTRRSLFLVGKSTETTIVPDSPLHKNIQRDKKIIYSQGSYKMDKEFWYDSFVDLGNVLGRFQELMDMPGIETLDYLRDATIQRFEFSLEFYWKVLRKI